MGYREVIRSVRRFDFWWNLLNDSNDIFELKLSTECDFAHLHSVIHSLSIIDNSYNSIKSLDLSICSELIKLIIGDKCCKNVTQFVLDGLNSLQSIQIGNSSFTPGGNIFFKENCHSLCIKNCKQLESIEIGRYSFSDYESEFQLSSIIW